MPDDFRFDVFLSHSSENKPVIRDRREIEEAVITLAEILGRAKQA